MTKINYIIIINYGILIICWGESMVLDLKKIFLVENEVLSVRTSVDLADAGQDMSVTFPEPVSADITVSNHAGVVYYEANVSFECHFNCDRCAAPSQRNYAFKFSHILVTELSEESGDDYIEAPDYKLDTDALLRDDILLELPSKFLCKESCKGLCPKCGKNLNEGPCNCNTNETDPRLAVLKQLL